MDSILFNAFECITGLIIYVDVCMRVCISMFRLSRVYIDTGNVLEGT